MTGFGTSVGEWATVYAPHSYGVEIGAIFGATASGWIVAERLKEMKDKLAHVVDFCIRSTAHSNEQIDHQLAVEQKLAEENLRWINLA